MSWQNGNKTERSTETKGSKGEFATAQSVRAEKPDRPVTSDSFLRDYITAVLEGEIPAGRELRLGLARLGRDFEGDRFHFDPTEGQRRIRFIESNLRHTERPFAGQPFRLELFQKAFIEAIYGFTVWDEEIQARRRRFQKVLFLVAKKNGKTPLIGAIVLSEFFCGGMGTRIMIGSNDYAQASLMYDHVNNMREESPTLQRATRKNQSGIFMGGFRSKKRSGKFSSQNKGWIKRISARTVTADGRNLAMAAMDEVWQLQEREPEIIASMMQAMSTQIEPLYIELTTEGTVNDGYLDHRLTYARQVLNGEVEDDSFLPWLYSQDCEEEIYQDRGSWIKSNPGLGVIKRASYLERELETARTTPSKRPLILCKDFNVKQNMASAWLSLETVLNPERFTLEEFFGAYYVAGLDMAETTDLNALKLIFMRSGGRRKFCWSHYWIPETKADAILNGSENSLNPERRDYREWERLGLVTITEGNSVDTAVIADYLFELLRRYKVMPFKVGYDNRFARSFLDRFTDLFGDGILEEVRQYPRVLSSPMREFEADLADKLFVYNDHAIDRWCFLNTAIRTDAEGYIKPAKALGRAEFRIDGTAAAIDAYAVLGWHKAEFTELCEG